jgi:hypothetical protein
MGEGNFSKSKEQGARSEERVHRDSRLDAQRSYWEKASSFLTLRDHRKPFSQDL